LIRLLAPLTFLPFLALAQTPAQVRQYLDDWDLQRAVPAARNYAASFGPTPTLLHAEALDLLGETLSLADDPAALSTLESALRMKADLLPPADLSFVPTHLRLAAERTQRREWLLALEQIQRAEAIVDARPGPLAEALRPQILLGLGVTATALGRYAEAKAALDESLASAQRVSGRSSRASADAHRALSTLAYLQTNLTLAEEHLSRSKAVAPNHPVEQAQILLLSAGLAMERGRYDEASSGLRQTLAFFEERLGPYNRRLLPVLRNIARGQRFQAQLPAAIQTSERALAISIRSFGEESSPTAELLGILAAAQAESGLLAEARQLYDRAIAVLTKLLGPTHSQVGVELFSLANLEQVMGDFESSLRHAGQSLAIREAIDGKESPRTVTIYALLGRVNALNGNIAKGRELTELAVAIGRRTVGDAHPRTTFARSDLGEVLYLAKDYAGAWQHFTAALAGQVKLFGGGSIRTAQGEYNLGLAERALGHHAEALVRFGAAGRIWREAFGPDYLFLAETSAGEAASLAALNRPNEAIGPALEAARVRRASLDAVAITAAEREALLFARVDRDGLLLALDLAASAKLDAAATTRVWDALIRDRAAVLDAMARRRPTADDPANAAALQQIASLKKELAQAALIGDPKLYLSRVTALRQSLDDAERALARQSSRFARQSLGTRTGWAEVLAALPAGSALVGYARGEAQYVAFVGRPGSATPRLFPLGPSARIDALVRVWQQEMERERNSAGRNARRNEETYRQAGAALRRVIWDPLLPALSNAKTVYTAPDGALQLVNLDTLPVGSAQYLAETGPLFQLLSSERDLVTPQAATSRKGSLLALGNPNFATLSSGTVCADLDRRRFPPLPGSGAEALAVGKLWNAQGGQGNVLSGATASESAFKAKAPGQQVIHLATHGFFLASACQRGQEAVLAGNPLLRSGLVLTAGGPTQEDGLLTAEEVSALRLDSAALVVLSGCDTARGAAQAGEGLLGLRRAFQAAGARQVVSSLWPVDDAATQQWMLRFYQARLQRSATIVQAVRGASVAELRTRRAAARSTHPFYWGGFVASGY
jgi:CHAT domain-containing protein